MKPLKMSALNALPYQLAHFLSQKTRRERLLLALAMGLLAIFVLLDFIYLPLFERLSQLSRLRTHAQSELSHSQALLSVRQDDALRHNLALDESLAATKQHLGLLSAYFEQSLRDEELLSPFALMPRLIALSKQGHFRLTTLQPHAALHALSIKGSGSFEGLKILLEALEAHEFLSLEYLWLRPSSDMSSMDFELLVLDARLLDSEMLRDVAGFLEISESKEPR